jgi:tRNA threonylcarbamoyladenosine biosynthesis protein TsaE
VIATGQPLLKTRFCGAKIGIADADSLKPQFQAPLFYVGREFRVIDCDFLRCFVVHKPDDNRIELQQHSAIGYKLAIALPDESETSRFAMRLAKAIVPGILIYLRGDLGAGKTTLVRALLHALGYQGRVKSPTYTLLEQYQAQGLHLCHFDLYRFQDPSEWESAGFNDELNDVNICLVEWPDKAGTLLPAADLEIIFDILPDGRKIILHANSNTGSECLRKLSS